MVFPLTGHSLLRFGTRSLYEDRSLSSAQSFDTDTRNEWGSVRQHEKSTFDLRIALSASGASPEHPPATPFSRVLLESPRITADPGVGLLKSDALRNEHVGGATFLPPRGQHFAVAQLKRNFATSA